MIKGQCLCGAITYLYHGEIEQSILCFCRDCQLAQGTIVAWNSALKRSKFEICTGYQILKEYFHTPNKARVFCGICASPIFSYRLDLPGLFSHLRPKYQSLPKYYKLQNLHEQFRQC